MQLVVELCCWSMLGMYLLRYVVTFTRDFLEARQTCDLAALSKTTPESQPCLPRGNLTPRTSLVKASKRKQWQTSTWHSHKVCNWCLSSTRSTSSQPSPSEPWNRFRIPLSLILKRRSWFPLEPGYMWKKYSPLSSSKFQREWVVDPGRCSVLLI